MIFAMGHHRGHFLIPCMLSKKLRKRWANVNSFVSLLLNPGLPLLATPLISLGKGKPVPFLGKT